MRYVLLLLTLCGLMSAADQKPLVINTTTGRTEQIQSGNNLSLPANTLSQALTVTTPVADTTPISTSNLLGLTANSSFRLYNVFNSQSTNNAFNYTGTYALRGLYGSSTHDGTGTVTSMSGVVGASTLIRAGGVVTRSVGVTAFGPGVTAAGTITTGNGVYITAPAISGGGTITTVNALEIEAVTGGGTNRAIFTQGAGTVVISDTTASSSTTTGSIVTSGGVGIAGVLSIGGQFNVPSATAMRNGSAGGSYFLDAGTLNIRDGNAGTGGANTGKLVTNSNLDASSVSTASVVINGGVGIAKRSYLGTIGSTFSGNVLAGVQDATAAVAGQVGEVLSGTQSTYTNYTTTATYQQVTTVSLTPGDWDVVGILTFSGNGATLTATGNAITTISTTTASAAGTTEGAGDITYMSEVINTVSGRQSTYLHKRINISATTSYFLNAQSTFTVGNPQFVGSLTATRMR